MAAPEAPLPRIVKRSGKYHPLRVSGDKDFHAVPAGPAVAAEHPAAFCAKGHDPDKLLACIVVTQKLVQLLRRINSVEVLPKQRH